MLKSYKEGLFLAISVPQEDRRKKSLPVIKDVDGEGVCKINIFVVRADVGIHFLGFVQPQIGERLKRACLNCFFFYIYILFY